jgi:hypothetical protein
MGVFLVRNRNQGPELLNWWTSAGHGACTWTAGLRVERKWNLQANHFGTSGLYRSNKHTILFRPLNQLSQVQAER